MPLNIYQPVRSEKLEIRLLILEPGDWHSNIVCKLEHRTLTSNPEYEALSYTWGKPEPRRKLWVNNVPVNTTVNLEVALRHLKSESISRTLWVDAICINQDDFNDRSAQVRIMYDIYHSATKVLAWAGDSSQESDAAMDLLLEFGQFLKDDLNHEDNFMERLFNPARWKHFGFDPSKRNWQALWSLYERPYWSRIWVVQELSHHSVDVRHDLLPIDASLAVAISGYLGTRSSWSAVPCTQLCQQRRQSGSQDLL
jgi:hypothetical protein